MANRQLSRYTPIWVAIKKEGKCQVASPSLLHKRLIKAVGKRKNEDLMYKEQLRRNGQRAVLYYAIDGDVVEFTLIKTIGLSDL